MAPTNELDASGLLYEGSDFEKWQCALRPLLAQHFPGISWSSPYWTFRIPPEVRFRDVCDGIWWHISLHVRSRISDNDRELPQRLFLALEATARPFRFMDLPAELRLRVYKLELAAKASPQTVKLLQQGTGRLPTTFEYNYDPLIEPQLLSISRQIRMKALPLHYTRTSTDLIFNERIFSRGHLLTLRGCLRQAPSDQGLRYRPTNAERVNAMHKWASTIMPDSMRNLRRISVQLPLARICTRNGCQDMLHFSLTVINGRPELHVTPHTWLKPGSQRLLSDHASTISKLAQTLKLEGEALIMVLMSRPDIWDQLELADR